LLTSFNASAKNVPQQRVRILIALFGTDMLII